MKTKTLKKFLSVVGDESASKMFNVTPRAIQSWRLGDREPRPDQARLIVKKTKRHKHGPITFDGIYGKPINRENK